jgi:hypothetical protein
MMETTQIYDNGDGIIVFLGESDIALAREKASERQSLQGRRDFRQAELNDKRSSGIWLMGTLAELAVARALGVEWTGEICEDVAGYQVKATDVEHFRLVLPTKGRHMGDDEVYISVVAVEEYGSLALWNVRGWAYAGEVRRDEYLTDLGIGERQKCYALPNHLLHPMSTLPGRF